MGVEEARRFIEGLQHLAPGFLRVTRVAQEPGEPVMSAGRIGLVEQE